MTDKTRIHNEPVDEFMLFRCQNLPCGRVVYHPQPWEDWVDRIREAYETQEFAPVYLVLVRTAEEPVRYYPLPRILNKQLFVPYFAEDAYQRVQAALNLYTSDAKVATRNPSFFSKLKSLLFNQGK